MIDRSRNEQQSIWVKNPTGGCGHPAPTPEEPLRAWLLPRASSGILELREARSFGYGASLLLWLAQGFRLAFRVVAFLNVHCVHLGLAMSRGPGNLQRFWLEIAFNLTEPWTFDEVCRAAWPEAFEPGYEMSPSFKRSLRRALEKLVAEGTIIPLGYGGRADPYRYCINPTVFPAGDPRRGKIMKHLEPYGFSMGKGGTLHLSSHGELPAPAALRVRALSRKTDRS